MIRDNNGYFVTIRPTENLPRVTMNIFIPTSTMFDSAVFIANIILNIGKKVTGECQT